VKPVEPDAALKVGREYLVAYVGVMGDQEGIDLLLESVRHLVFDKGRNDIQFVLVGGGPQLEGLQALSRQLGLSTYVTFTGRAPDQVLFKVLSTADVCVNPDRVNTMNDLSTMNKILEYMAFRKPIVQFEVREGRRSADRASLYALPNDPVDFAIKIVQLLDDSALRHEMGEFGYQRLRSDLSWEHQVPRLLKAYERALDS
jgi:glycosyltransferase involved in cell wall biosynthesis